MTLTFLLLYDMIYTICRENITIQMKEVNSVRIIQEPSSLSLEDIVFHSNNTYSADSAISIAILDCAVDGGVTVYHQKGCLDNTLPNSSDYSNSLSRSDGTRLPNTKALWGKHGVAVVKNIGYCTIGDEMANLVAKEVGVKLIDIFERRITGANEISIASIIESFNSTRVESEELDYCLTRACDFVKIVLERVVIQTIAELSQ